MLKPWSIYYNGQLAVRKLTRNGAQSTAWALVKAKGWDVGLVEVRQESGAKNESKEVTQ